MTDATGPPTAAGRWSVWATDARAAVDAGGTADVPCGSCTACCTASQFVHVGPDETGTLAHIPAALLFPAPGLPSGHLLLGYDDRGHCPMFVDGRCSIYDHRPRACRTYDCRVFAATGVTPAQPEVAARVRQWRFDVADAADEATRDALRAATRFLDRHADELADVMPTHPTPRAVLALRVHHLFRTATDGPRPEPDLADVRAAALPTGRRRKPGTR